MFISKVRRGEERREDGGIKYLARRGEGRREEQSRGERSGRRSGDGSGREEGQGGEGKVRRGEKKGKGRQAGGGETEEEKGIYISQRNPVTSFLPSGSNGKRCQQRAVE